MGPVDAIPEPQRQLPGDDRFAYVDVGWLLERMKAYRGMAVLATTSREDIDRAFLGQIRHVVPFTHLARGRR